MNYLRTYSEFTGRISNIAAHFAMLAVVLMACHILLEIFLRAFFQSSTFVLDEFVGYEVAAMTFLGLGNALDHKALLRLNMLLVRVSGPKRTLLEMLNATLTIALFGFLAVFLIKLMMRNYMRGTTSISILEVPVWIPQAVIVTGLIVFCLQLTGLFAKALRSPNDLD